MSIDYMTHCLLELEKTASISGGISQLGNKLKRVVGGADYRRHMDTALEAVKQRRQLHGGTSFDKKFVGIAKDKVTRHKEMARKILSNRGETAKNVAVAGLVTGGSALGTKKVLDHLHDDSDHKHASEEPHPAWEKAKIVGGGIGAFGLGTLAGLTLGQLASHGAEKVTGRKLDPHLVRAIVPAMGAAATLAYSAYKAREAEELENVSAGPKHSG